MTIQATIGWCWNHQYLYELETGEALLFSSPSYGGDGSWQYFSTWRDARAAAGLEDGFVRYKGETTFDGDFVLAVCFAPGGKLIPEEGEPYYRADGYVGQEEWQERLRAPSQSFLEEELSS